MRGLFCLVRVDGKDRSRKMLLSYLRTALRSLLHQRLYTVINIVGLAVGLACSLLVLLYVRHELSYEDFNRRQERVFRLVRGEEIRHPAALAGLIRGTFPEVEEVARLFHVSDPLISHGKVQTFQRVATGDPAIFSLLDLRFVSGDPAALEMPHKIAISTEMARVYFGHGVDAVGETLRWDTLFECEVAGVYELPDNTHFALHFVLSLSTVAVEPAFGRVHNWGGFGGLTYVATRGQGIDRFGERLLEAARRESVPEYRRVWADSGPLPALQPIADIHLHSHTKDELDANGHASDVHLLAAIGVFVLLVACGNFVNLSTARSVERAKEVGLRKVIGASRRHLLIQFIGESVLQVALASALALVFAQLVLPSLSAFVDKPLQLDPGRGHHLLWIGAGVLCVAFAGASFPSFFLSGLPPLRVFRDAPATGSLGSAIRRRLVELRFAMSVLLVLATGIVHLQLQLLHQTDLGFDKERLLVFRVGYEDVMEQNGVLARRIADLPPISGVARFHHTPFERLHPDDFRDSEGNVIRATQLTVDASFVPVLRLDLVAGRNVRSDLPPNQPEAVLNETAATAFGRDPQGALGMTLYTYNGPATIVGVVRDFHYESLRQSVGAIIMVSPNYPLTTEAGEPLQYYNHIGVRILPGMVAEGVEQVEAVWTAIVPDYPLDYWFLDDAFERQYRAEARLSRLVSSFAGLAVFLASLGIFALAASSTERRTKEIGVRKALGASAPSILLLLYRDFGRLLLVGTSIAAVPGLWAMHHWLEGYAYRIDPGVEVLIGAVVVVGLAAGAAVSWEVSRATRMDPVEALRHE